MYISQFYIDKCITTWSLITIVICVLLLLLLLVVVLLFINNYDEFCIMELYPSMWWNVYV